MTVGRLRELITGVADDMVVLIPLSQEFDGLFYSPCGKDSGVAQMAATEVETLGEVMDALDGDKEEFRWVEAREEDTFLLIPCNFTEAKDNIHELN